MDKHIVVILGMHRSGTSALTRVLNLMGMDLGRDLVPAERDNPKGFWEDARIVAIHERFLQDTGRSSSDPRVFSEQDWTGRAADAAQSALLQVLSSYRQEANIWGVKDPRHCRLLPLWAPLYPQIGRSPHFLLTVRNPLEVAGSLEKRDHFPFRRGMLLWLIHNLEALVLTQGSERVIISFDQLLSAPEQVIDKIRSGLSLPWPELPGDFEARMSGFLDPELRHHRTPVPQLPAGEGLELVDSLLLEEWIAQVYTCLQTAAEHPRSTIDPAVYDIAAKLSNRLTQLEGLMDKERAPHFHQWFCPGNAWDRLQKADRALSWLPVLRPGRLLQPAYGLRYGLVKLRNTWRHGLGKEADGGG
jgi:hypothetical protein